MTMTLIDIAESIGDRLMSGTSPAASRARIAANPATMEAVRGMSSLIGHYREGSRRAGLEIVEAITTSDLARFATGAIIDREMLANYDALPLQWTKFCTPTTTASFKPKQMSAIEIGGQTFKDVPERTPYQMAEGAELSEYPVAVKKTGLMYGWTFEAGINDDLEQLLAVPKAFPQMAIDTEDDRALRLLVDLETGALNTAFFNPANGNLGTLVLNAGNLETVLTALRQKRDPKTGGLMTAQYQLVVGPALEMQAERILNVDRVRVSDDNGGFTEEPNPLRGKITLAVNEKQPGQSWIVMPKPGSSRRPALLLAKLRGYESPEFRYKADGGQLVGGGVVPAGAGSFDDDTVWFRGRHIVGAAHADPTLTYGSDNTGS